MKTLTEVLKKVESLRALEAKLREENPDLKHGSYEIKNVPLKVILKVGEKLNIKPSYDRWGKKIELRSYSFSESKLDIEISSVPCEQKVKEPVPVIEDEYVEIKDKKKQSLTI